MKERKPAAITFTDLDGYTRLAQIDEEEGLRLVNDAGNRNQKGAKMFFRRRSQKVDVLSKVPLFSNLAKRRLDLIARHADEVSLDTGAVLTRQDEMGLEFLLIVEGQARVERNGKSIAHLGAGDCVGEMSLIDGQPRSATVVAETPLVLLVVHRRSFSYLLSTVPELQRELLITLCKRLRQADEALID